MHSVQYKAYDKSRSQGEKPSLLMRQTRAVDWEMAALTGTDSPMAFISRETICLEYKKADNMTKQLDIYK